MQLPPAVREPPQQPPPRPAPAATATNPPLPTHRSPTHTKVKPRPYLIGVPTTSHLRAAPLTRALPPPPQNCTHTAPSTQSPTHSTSELRPHHIQGLAHHPKPHPFPKH
ncbi:hypothetical protein GJAV_G00103410 [Gymnothorax javanicus]|nr:hypothetical protein GJAV_G00103410 [Gymnothorax javanicus]